MTATLVEIDAKLPEVTVPVKPRAIAPTSFQRSPSKRRKDTRNPEAVKAANLVAITEWAELYDDEASFLTQDRSRGDKITGSVETAVASILRGATRQEYPIAFLHQRLTHLKLLAGELETILDDIRDSNREGMK